MNPEYAKVYRTLYEQHWWWRAREALLLREIHRNAPPNGWGTILDVGCGDGLFFDRLQRFGEVWGVEADPSLVAGDGVHRGRIHVGSFDQSYRGVAPYGLILMLDVLEHMSDPVAALRHARALLKPGGSLLVTVPAFPLLWTQHDELNLRVTRYTRTTFQRIAREAGFMASSRYCFHWLFPAKLGVRLLERFLASTPVPAAVPPSWMNTALLGVCRAEQRFVEWAGLPFGSSLLAWCLPRGSEDAVLERTESPGAELAKVVGE